MKKILLSFSLIVLSACADRPFESTQVIYNESFIKPGAATSQIRVHRVKQLTGSALGDDCPLIVSVDGIEAAGLQQNQYVDLYLKNGNHSISVRFKCALTSWKKSLNILADGSYAEYQAESGGVGQYRLWQTR
ncbi:hypothetical protein E0L21_22525 [Kosakonia quasisacchari]|uniref:Lipoprotein n=1 Tax=Kosakonia quasisacchari TaxID=2529380 RepID=A0A4R0GLD9_9ENTR|nr:hypothetical protein [Kosakonia quasisacchari]TCB98146.1 hypothetical protein E0L21_22525 [Kosakonia quasisacchari]